MGTRGRDTTSQPQLGRGGTRAGYMIACCAEGCLGIQPLAFASVIGTYSMSPIQGYAPTQPARISIYSSTVNREALC